MTTYHVYNCMYLCFYSQAVNIVVKPTTTQQSSTAPKKGDNHNFFRNMICMPYNACRTFLGDKIKSFWQSFLKFRENLISIYRPPVTAVNNVGSWFIWNCLCYYVFVYLGTIKTFIITDFFSSLNELLNIYINNGI